MEDQTFTIQGPKPVVGAWVIGGPAGLHIYMPERPRWFTRLMSSWLLEWQWQDAPTRSTSRRHSWQPRQN